MSATNPSTEPEVPACKELFTHPREVVDIFVSHIEERRDLLGLALVSKSFCAMIIPSLLNTIHIRCDPSRIDVWQWLTSEPYLAARTRTLELIDELVPEYLGYCRAMPECDDMARCKARTPLDAILPSFLPKQFEPPTKQKDYEDSVLALATAVMHMTHLRRFRWSDNLLIPCTFEPLFLALGTRTDMDEFSLGILQGGLHYLGPPVIFKPISPELGNFPHITTFCLLVFDDLPWHHDESNSLIQDWIMQFTTLKHLQLVFSSQSNCRFDFHSICRRAHWPSLVELSLKGDIDVFQAFVDNDSEGDYSPSTEIHLASIQDHLASIQDHLTSIENHLASTEIHDASTENHFATFLRNHPTIERLKIHIWGDYTGFIHPQTESRIRSLALGGGMPGSSLGDWFPLHIARQIEYFECYPSAADLPTLRAMTSLHALFVLEMSVGLLPHLVAAVPHIRQLRIPYRRWCNQCPAHEHRHFVDAIVNCLLQLTHLVQLEGGFVVNGGELYKTQYLLRRLTAHESLVYVDSLTRAQWDVVLGEGLAESAELRLPCVAVPNIMSSAGLYVHTL
ncbi:hypothetical protein BU17DRAFT_93809 [Hysterangium stoloniferum]|nr:hypothetical protein BU17DRAFT_93809 [Hysterangium stoloniferum]